MPYDNRKNEMEGPGEERNAPLTAGDLRSILEANKKSVEIYIEVEKQNEDVLEKLETLEAMQKESSSHAKSIDKSLFKLVVILGAVGTSTVVAALKLLFMSGHG